MYKIEYRSKKGRIQSQDSFATILLTSLLIATFLLTTAAFRDGRKIIIYWKTGLPKNFYSFQKFIETYYWTKIFIHP